MTEAPGDQRVVLFDLDGCIVDSTEPIRRCLDAAFADHGLPPIPPDGLGRHVGPPLHQTLRELLDEQGRDPSLVDGIVEGYRSRYAEVSVELAVAYPGVADLIADLAGADERVGVVTSKPERFAVPIVKALGLDEHLDLVVGPGLTEAETKDVTLARALDLIGPCDRSGSVMIGDRRHDIEAARHHGLASVGVLWGFGDRVELETAGATAIVASAGELAARLRRPQPDDEVAVRAVHEWFERHSGWAPPDEESMADWLAEGMSRCPDDCLVAYDARCEHGLATWWLVLRHADQPG